MRTMKSRNAAIVVGLFCALSVHGEFVTPTPVQVKAAALNPAGNMAGVLRDASVNQAAEVTKAVIAQVLLLKLSPEAQAARITEVVGGAMGSVPAELRLAFATALGSAIGGSPVIRQTPGAVTAIQSAVAAAGGTVNGSAMATSFGNAYQTETQAGTGSDPTAKGDQPPVTTGYEGQNK